ncbi:MAG: hypothetical protein ACPL5I_03485 [Thermodesulfobacteriota bacterium]
MDEDRLLELAQDKRFIPGIYNYCDRWCARCPFTQRCLNFAMDQEELAEAESQDVRNAAFWEKMGEILAQTQKLLERKAKELGINLEELATANEEVSLSQQHEAVENHVLSRAARAYSQKVTDWFAARENILKEAGTFAYAGIELTEAFEVIHWYQYFIPAKVARALYGLLEDDDDLAQDADGSAKIALIALDRSLAAWSVVWHFNRFLAESIAEIISFLTVLRQAIEETFPHAWSFKRPGFDTED